MPKLARAKAEDRGLAEGYRSGLEEDIGEYLKALGVPVQYEPFKIAYIQPVKARTYTPDFALPNGIIIESKGRFLTADRQKHKLIKGQYPDLDIRFVFQRPKERISKTSVTTYAKWAETHGFQWAKLTIPLEWINEPPCPMRIAALEKARKQ